MMNKEEIIEVLNYLEDWICGDLNTPEEVAEAISSSHNKNPKVIINKQTKEVKICEHSINCLNSNVECPYLDNRNVQCF